MIKGNRPGSPDSRLINTNGGFLCLTMHWIPNPDDPDPDVPGQKLSMSSYIPLLPQQACLCNSGKAYRSCCRRRPYWHPVCPNPGMLGYSFVELQTATFEGVAGDSLRQRLLADARLHCTQNDPEHGFWIYWGAVPYKDNYGILCLGDIELKHNRTLAVTAMSNERMRVLLDFVQEVAGGELGAPQIQRQSVMAIDKQTRAMIEAPPPACSRPSPALGRRKRKLG